METKGWTEETLDERLEKQIEQAKAAWVKANQNEPHAEFAEYNRRQKLLIIKLINGVEFRFPPHLIEGLPGASPEQLADVYLSETGDSIHWESLDVDLSIPGLVSGIIGTKS